MSSSSTTPIIYKQNKSLKPFKRNRRLSSRMKTSSQYPMTTPQLVNNYQMLFVPPSTAHTQVTQPNMMIATMGTVPRLSSSAPRVTTTIVPLHTYSSEQCEKVKSVLVPSINIINSNDQQNNFEYKPNNVIRTHLIDDWIIRESSEPFQSTENKRSLPIEHTVHKRDEKETNVNESNVTNLSPTLDVHQWTVDDVCAYLNRILQNSSYSSIVREHLIDGAALILLKDVHLASIFKMPLGPRLKLLSHIDQLIKEGTST